MTDTNTTDPITDPTTDLDPIPPTFDEQLEDVFARRFAEESDASTDPSEAAEGIPHPADTAESPASSEDTAPALDAVQPPAADPALDAAPVAQGDPATGTPGPVDFDPETFGIGSEEPAPSTSSAGVLTVPTPDGGTFDLDITTARSLLALGAWSQNLAPEIRESFAAIEQGQAVAVNRQEYERFSAWAQNRQADEWDDLDPAVAQRLAALEAENAQLRAVPLTTQYTAQADQAAATFTDTATQYAAQRGLSNDEMTQVFNDAINAGIIGTFAESMRTYSPSGVLIRDADYAEVARRAFDFALIQNPELHTRALTRAADRNPIATGEPTLAPVEVDPTAIKKARAGSLASAPSAAVSHPPVDPRNMSPEALRAAMTDEIRAAMAGA